MIQAANGVVTAEEMAPYLDPPPMASAFDDDWDEVGTNIPTSASGSSSEPQRDEAYVLPALIKFGGEPFVDDEGHLLYRFPSLQRTVVQRVRDFNDSLIIGISLQLIYFLPFLPFQEVLGPRSVRRGPDPKHQVDMPLKIEPQYEQSWEMTAASSGQLVGIIILCIVNIIGVTWLAGLVVRGGSVFSCMIWKLVILNHLSPPIVNRLIQLCWHSWPSRV